MIQNTLTNIGMAKTQRNEVQAYKRAPSLLFALALSSFGIAVSAAAAEPTPETPARKGSMMDSTCPMKVSGVTIAASDVPGGAALSFTTRTGDVADLRQRVRALADMRGCQCAGLMGGHHGEGSGHMMGKAAAPASSATVEDIEGGARLILKPKDPAQLDALRQHARKRAEHMGQNECPMMKAEHGASNRAPDAPTPQSKEEHQHDAGTH